MKLTVATSAAWLPLALERFNEVLADHAHCEKKAAANALSLIQLYPDVPGLAAKMARLAREESAHLAKVLELLDERGLALPHDLGDPYAKGLQLLLRHGSEQRRLDRLLIAGIIEARSAERLQLLADGLTDPPLKKFYRELAVSEDGHQELFVRLAHQVSGAAAADARLHELLVAEGQLIERLPIRAAVH